jgi:hypothetical protein
MFSRFKHASAQWKKIIEETRKADARKEVEVCILSTSITNLEIHTYKTWVRTTALRNQHFSKRFVRRWTLLSPNNKMENPERQNQIILKEIGKRIASLRRNMGYTSHETFAFDHNLPRVNYWRLETGKTNCTMKTLVKILTIQNLTLEVFFTMQTEKENEIK